MMQHYTRLAVTTKRNLSSTDYVAFGAAKALFETTDEITCLSGPAGTGKSRASLEYIHRKLLSFPKSRALMARQTRSSMTETTMVTYEENVLANGFGHMYEGVGRRSRSSYRYDNGSEFIMGGLDLVTRLMSSEYDLIYVPEAIETTESDIESLTSRLRNGKMDVQRLIMDTNPGPPTHWLKQAANAGRVLMLESRHEDNPRLYRNGAWTEEGIRYIGILDRLTGARRDRLRFGRWVQAEGVVYPQWDAARHLVNRFAIPDTWRKFRAIDFGYTNPFVCQWWALSPDDEMYLYRELYMTGRTVRSHAEQINQFEPSSEFEATIADHDAEDRATLSECGIDTIAATKDMTRGIQGMQERLKPRGNGRHGLYVMRDSLIEIDPALVEAKKPMGLAQEIEGYVWPQVTAGRLVSESPIKLDDHSCDAARYAAMYADNPHTFLIDFF